MFLAAIPASCRIGRSNHLKEERQRLIVDDRQDRLGALRREQARIDFAIDQAGKDLETSRQSLDAATARILPLTTELSDRLRFIKTLEEDLAAARKQREELVALQKQAAGLSGQLAQTKAEAESAQQRIDSQKAELAARVAAVQALDKELAAIGALTEQIRKQLAAAAAKVGPPEQPPKKQ